MSSENADYYPRVVFFCFLLLDEKFQLKTRAVATFANEMEQVLMQESPKPVRKGYPKKSQKGPTTERGIGTKGPVEIGVWTRFAAKKCDSHGF